MAYRVKAISIKYILITRILRCGVNNLEITDWVAIYGAVIGSISAALYLRNWWYDRPHIKVEVAYAMGFGAFVNKHLISLSAINTGKQTVYISGSGFQVQENRNIIFIDSPQGMPQPKFPVELLPNNKFTIYFSIPELAKALIEENNGQLPLTAWFTDATDKYYKEKINPINFHSWIKSACS
jgi:hypothetical protein